MTGENRRRITVAAVVALAVVVIFGAGAAAGGRGAGGSEDWRSRLAGLGVGAQLTTTDVVSATDGCEVGVSAVTVTGFCTLSVPEFGGGFSLETVKTADLVPTGPVRIAVSVEGATIQDTVGAGETIELVVGRSGGSVTIACLTLSPCVIEGLAAPEEGEP